MAKGVAYRNVIFSTHIITTTMQKINLVPKPRTYMEDVLELNPVSFVPNTFPAQINLYWKTSNEETGKLINEGNAVVPIQALVLLSDVESNLEAINEMLVEWDVVAVAPTAVVETPTENA